MKLLTICRTLFLITIAGLLAACGGGSSNDSSSGTLSIGLTDAPIENAAKVVVAFAGVIVKPEDGPALDAVPVTEGSCDSYDMNTGLCSIDLLSLTGMQRREVFSRDLPVGSYSWVRLQVQAERNVIDSYIEFEDGTQCSLYVPSGAQTGLKVIGGITVTANAVSDYTLDFDVKKSIVQPPGQMGDLEACAANYFLKPVIRIVDTSATGGIAGMVPEELLAADESCAMDDMGIYENVSVYAFADPDAMAVADDFDGADDAVTSAQVVWNGMDYGYEIGYLLAPESYKLALTCTPDLDDVENDDFDPASVMPQDFGFVAEMAVDTVADEIVDGSFSPPPMP